MAVALIAMLLSATVSAQPPAVPAAATDRKLELSLPDAVRLAVQNNLDIERSRFEPRIARTDVDRERAAFDPTVGGKVSIAQTKELPTSRINQEDAEGNFIGSRIILPFSKNSEVTPFFKQKIITGGDYELRFVNTRVNESPTVRGSSIALEDPRYESSLDLTVTQPLLRDFGIVVNRAPVQRAQNAEAIADQRVIQSVVDVVFQVQESYWNLVFQIDDLAAKRESQKLAEDFLAENKIRVELGTLAPIELVQAETQVKLREESVIIAEAAVKDGEDQLKDILNIPQIIGTWQLRVTPTDKPTFEPVSIPILQEKIEQAMQDRPDMIESQLDIDSRRIAQREAHNQRLPRLDFQARGRLSAFGGDIGTSLSEVPDSDGYEWSFGLEFEYPLGNRAARNALMKRQYELQQALVGQRDLKLTIVREIRQAVRGIETAIKRVEVTRAASTLSRTQLEAEQEKFRLGLSTSFGVLEFQRDLTDALSSETKALSDYNVELARLDQRTGGLRYVERPDVMGAATQPSSALQTRTEGSGQNPPENPGPALISKNLEPLGKPVRQARASGPGALETARLAEQKSRISKAYTIQVGAFLVEKYARRMMSDLREKGYNPYMVGERDAKNRLWRKVCFGHFKSQEQARAMETSFQAQENRAKTLIILTEFIPVKPTGEGG